MFLVRQLFIGIPIRVNYFLFKEIAENRKYDPIRPNEALLSLVATTIILAAIPVVVIFTMISGNFSIASILKILVGAVFCLAAEKFFLTLIFNQLVKRSLM